MANVSAAAITTADGIPLKISMARAERRRRANAFLLVLPLLAFVLISFVFPIGDMLLQSAWDPTISNYMPRTVELLENWDERGGDLPDEAVFESTAEELVAAYKEKAIGKIATRLNYDLTAIRSVVNRTARAAELNRNHVLQGNNARDRQTLGRERNLDDDKESGKAIHGSLLSRRVGLRVRCQGMISSARARRGGFYVTLYLRTAWVSALITLVGLLLAYPLSYVLATRAGSHQQRADHVRPLPSFGHRCWCGRRRDRAAANAWCAKRRDGVAGTHRRQEPSPNDLQHVRNCGRDDPDPASVHVLPLFQHNEDDFPVPCPCGEILGSVAGEGILDCLFSTNFTGIGAGSLLVFILAVGYYITPALVGGRTGQLISNLIAFHMQHSLNWDWRRRLAQFCWSAYWPCTGSTIESSASTNWHLVEQSWQIFPFMRPGLERSWYYGLRVIAALVLLFLMAPLLVVIPLSLNAVPYFTFTKGMLSLDPEAYSLRWYREVIQDERWLLAIKNSFSIAFSATLLSTFLGTLAAIGLSRAHMPYRTTIMSILISPIVVPLVIMATGMYFFYAKVGLNSTYLGVVLAHRLEEHRSS